MDMSGLLYVGSVWSLIGEHFNVVGPLCSSWHQPLHQSRYPAVPRSVLHSRDLRDEDTAADTAGTLAKLGGGVDGVTTSGAFCFEKAGTPQWTSASLCRRAVPRFRDLYIEKYKGIGVCGPLSLLVFARPRGGLSASDGPRLT